MSRGRRDMGLGSAEPRRIYELGPEAKLEVKAKTTAKGRCEREAGTRLGRYFRQESRTGLSCG